jgi:hypothetical protein
MRDLIGVNYSRSSRKNMRFVDLAAGALNALRPYRISNCVEQAVATSNRCVEGAAKLTGFMPWLQLS